MPDLPPSSACSCVHNLAIMHYLMLPPSARVACMQGVIGTHKYTAQTCRPEISMLQMLSSCYKLRIA